MAERSEALRGPAERDRSGAPGLTPGAAAGAAPGRTAASACPVKNCSCCGSQQDGQGGHR
ncbi:predicted protein [Streptomyces viridosporus ATCC 14672]|uniref:Predicted protein n=1 Tax=Streptomyces viridosporus (strain ATCC 14672 / DSM 40746 / JCM 4963 / KCTC 9882 / NRRL B-12104 / FH 1290) TaxID=566461 RepID=D5ZZA7_STRV1|nr:predicted protein [Streptomyces viridosporus ATCC 14672]